LGSDAIAGFNTLLKEAPDHFHMILSKPAPDAPQDYVDKYLLLPGIAMYFAGQWIVNLNYWGCNQYITQRALGADLQTARKGILFAGFLKLLMPVIVMLPGIAAYVLHKGGHLKVDTMDAAYSSILGFLPAGLKGLSIAALTAAIVASLAGKLNSISTIYTLDIHKKYFQKELTERRQVWTGRLVAVIAILISLLFTWEDLLGIGAKGGFTFIQEYTGFISPGVFAMFLLGMFWKRTTGAAAVAGLITGLALSIFFKNFAVSIFGHETWLYTAFQTMNDKGELVWQIPFLINMGWSFFFTVLVMVGFSMAGPKVNPKAFELDKSMFKLKPSIIAMIVITLLILTVLYAKFW
jgi:SSS family solute:Na+ symporter